MAQPIRETIAGIAVHAAVLDSSDALDWDIAKRLCTDTGTVVVVCEEPALLLPLVKQQWEKAADRTRTARTRTFSLEASPEALETLDTDEVVFATAGQLLRWAPECWVMYVTCPISKEDLYILTAWMPKDGMVVIYKVGS